MDVAAEVLQVLRRAVYADQETLDVLAVYTGLAHLAPHGTFFTVPYISLEGPAGSGKSTAGRVMALLSGGAVSSGLTPASLFRLVHENPGTLLVMDESDAMLRGVKREAFSNLLLEGDHWAASVSRTETAPIVGKIVRTYRIFAPKVLVSIRGIDLSALRRRVIPCRMEPAPLAFSSRWDPTSGRRTVSYHRHTVRPGRLCSLLRMSWRLASGKRARPTEPRWKSGSL